MKKDIPITIKNNSSNFQPLALFSPGAINSNLDISWSDEWKYSDLMKQVDHDPIMIESVALKSKFSFINNSKGTVRIVKSDPFGSQIEYNIFLLSAVDIDQKNSHEIEILYSLVLDHRTTIRYWLQPNDRFLFHFEQSKRIQLSSMLHSSSDAFSKLNCEGFDVEKLNPSKDRVKECEMADRLEWFPLWVENKSDKVKKFSLPTDFTDFELCEKNNEGFDFYVYDERTSFDEIIHLFEKQKTIDVRRIYSDNTTQFESAVSFLSDTGERTIGAQYWQCYFTSRQLTPNIIDYPEKYIRLKQIQCRDKKFSKRIEFNILPKTNVCLFLKMTEIKTAY